VAGLAGGALKAGFAPATHAGWWIITGCGIGVLALGLLTTTPWAIRTAEATAACFASEGSASGRGPAARLPAS
jgi:hypothetical protein